MAESGNNAVELRDVAKRFGDFVALDRTDLDVPEASFVTFLGPSGCGKTTTLRMIAGLLDPSEGEIRVRGRRVNDVPIYRRNLGLVFQNYALFPHKTIAENVAFGLKYRKVPRSEAADRVREALELVRLPHLGDRRPNQLSGGQQQRVALARAVVIQPDVLLLDEPLSALDANLREEMRIELKRIQRELGIATIFVTHDQSEALAMSDRIVVMRDGVIQQQGTPEEVYNNPRTEFVACFLGHSNVLTGHVSGQEDDTVRVQLNRSGREILARPVEPGKREMGAPYAWSCAPSAFSWPNRTTPTTATWYSMHACAPSTIRARWRATSLRSAMRRCRPSTPLPNAPSRRARTSACACAAATACSSTATRTDIVTNRPQPAADTRPPSHLFYQNRQRRPLLDRAEGIYMHDVEGRSYIDGCSGAMVSNIGHSNPRVLAAMQAQMERATFAYRLQFENDPAETLASRVAGLMPGDLDRVFFVSGGSEAVESCVKLARQYALATGEAQRYKVISRYPSYHGSTLGALALTGYTPMTAPFDPMMTAMPKIPAPTCHLDRDDLSADERGRRYADMLEAEIQRQGPETVLAFIMEPVGGASTGALVAPDSYYPRIREICDRHGILLIHDEVMSGAGRTGRFLASDHWGVTPDMAALSKGFAAGYVPLGAMVASRRVVEPVLSAGGFIHGYTYAGNPLACAAGNAVLDEILDHDLMGNAERTGGYLYAGCRRSPNVSRSSAMSAARVCCWPSNWSPTAPRWSRCRRRPWPLPA